MIASFVIFLILFSAINRSTGNLVEVISFLVASTFLTYIYVFCIIFTFFPGDQQIDRKFCRADQIYSCIDISD